MIMRNDNKIQGIKVCASPTGVFFFNCIGLKMAINLRFRFDNGNLFRVVLGQNIHGSIDPGTSFHTTLKRGNHFTCKYFFCFLIHSSQEPPFKARIRMWSILEVSC